MNFEERVTQFDKFLDGMVSDEFRTYLINNGFFTAPASTKFHGNYEGGLFDHSFAVAKFLIGLTKRNELTWQRHESPYIVGMFHDLCKIDQYTVDETTRWKYRDDTLFKGHGVKSVLLLSQYYRLTEEEIACIVYHMGAFTDKEQWQDYTRAVNCYPNVLWTHHEDMLASHVAGI